MWLDHKGFDAAFAGWWNNTHVEGWEGYKFITKLKANKGPLKSWNSEVWGFKAGKEKASG